MPVKSGNCVKTGAQVLVLEYGRVQGADIFLIGDCILLNFGDCIHQGRWPSEGETVDYQVMIGMDGFWHEGKNVLVVPKHQFQGQIMHRNGCKELCTFGARPPFEEILDEAVKEARALGYGITYWSPGEMRGVPEGVLLDLVVPYGNDRIAELAEHDEEE